MHVKTLILGGGLTGLSTAYHLEKSGQSDYLVLEKEHTPGGLCRSIFKKGFTFDFSGHLLHLHTSYGKKLVRELLAGQLGRLKRRAWIYTGKVQVPFPFQANLHALPPDLRARCLKGLQDRQNSSPTVPKNFEDFCVRAFGKGIYQIFMRPYNTKLWGRSPRQLTCEWCGPFVPTPSAALIKKSAVEKLTTSFGYNAFFYYPQTGGCGALVAALRHRISQLKIDTPVTQVDLKNKMVRAGGRVFTYDTLVNTLPLPVFLRLLKNAPALTRQAAKLAVAPVTVYQVGFKGKVKPFSWVYFPDKDVPFYRVGLQSGFSSANAPKGCYSLYVELPGLVKPGLAKERQILRALVQKGIINEYDEKIISFWQPLPYAYAVYDKNRTPVVNRLLAALKKQHCFLAGRYGRWEYSFMEKSLLEGRNVARQVKEVL
ncbi:MAG: FAD-dependent oxidoreductase [Elusimicrobiaceae bacterium]|nr:FAD-dependent oxidoreductase [Elusimicrobiaceae bacterium]